MLRKEAFATIRLAIPVIIGELAQMSLHIIDAAMVGAIDYHQLAASALVIIAMNIPFVLGIGMTISVSQMVSLAHGKNDDKAISHYFFNGFLVCAITAVLISLSLYFGRNMLLHLDQDPTVVKLALPFMQLMSLSIIPMLLFMTLKQFTDGLQRTRTAMLLSLAGLPLNIFLNWLLIYGNWGFPRLELLGAGWSTLITRTVLFLALALVIRLHPGLKRYWIHAASEWKLKWKTVKELLSIGIPSSLQIAMEAGAFAVSGLMIGTIGAVAQAAHQIALSCVSATFMVSLGLAQAGSIRVSNAYGKGAASQIRLIGRSTLITALIYGTVCAAGLALFRNSLPGVFNDNAEVAGMASVLLLFAAVFQISDSTQAIGAGLLRGMKDVKMPTILIGIAYWIIGLPAGYLFAFPMKMGASGIWLGLIIGLTAASIFLTVRFLSGSRKIG
jgi:MATE family multidrug resistance protein